MASSSCSLQDHELRDSSRSGIGRFDVSTNQRADQGGLSQKERIERLRQRVREIAGGDAPMWESDTQSDDATEQFLRQVIAFESGPETTLFAELTAVGVELPDPALLTEGELTSKLWETLEALGRMRVFISDTDHLSDRELYALLWHDELRQEMPMLDDDPASAWHIQLLSSGSEENTRLYLRFFADEDYRTHWMKEFPDYDMPAHEDPPYDRDRLLLQWD